MFILRHPENGQHQTCYRYARWSDGCGWHWVDHPAFATEFRDIDTASMAAMEVELQKKEHMQGHIIDKEYELAEWARRWKDYVASGPHHMTMEWTPAMLEMERKYADRRLRG